MTHITDWTARPPRHVEPYSWRVCLAFLTVGSAVIWAAAYIAFGG